VSIQEQVGADNASDVRDTVDQLLTCEEWELLEIIREELGPIRDAQRKIITDLNALTLGLVGALGDADRTLNEARLAKKHPEHLTWATFVLYGNPTFRLQS
jgi:hypothetical protein